MAVRSLRASLILTGLGAAAALASFGPQAPVRAQDADGALAFIHSQAARNRPAAQPSPVPTALAPVAAYYPSSFPTALPPGGSEPLYAPRGEVSLPSRARTRYARLPEDDGGAEDRRKAKDAADRLAEKGPVAALLADPTLRPGDVVMFPDGPRVFKGGSDAPHRMASFEAPERSRLVSKAERARLAAIGGRPAPLAREARSKVKPVLAGRDLPASQATAEIDRAGVRVVYEGAVPR